MCELGRGPSSWSVHWAKIACYIDNYMNKHRTLMKHRLQLQLLRGDKEENLPEISEWFSFKERQEDKNNETVLAIFGGGCETKV